MFEKIIGQNRAITLLRQAIALDRIAPAYLFVGASGIGRSLSAAQFAQKLLTRNLPEKKKPLAERKIEHRNHPDFRWLEPTFSDYYLSDLFFLLKRRFGFILIFSLINIELANFISYIYVKLLNFMNCICVKLLNFIFHFFSIIFYFFGIIFYFFGIQNKLSYL